MEQCGLAENRVDLREFGWGEREVCEGGEVVFELDDFARADEGGGDARVTQDPSEGHLREALATGLGDGVEPLDFGEDGGRDAGGFEETVGFAGPGIGGDAGEVTVGEETLGERAEGDAADAFLGEDIEELRLDPAVEHAVAGLVNQAGRTEFAEDLSRAGGVGGAVVGEADVKGFAAAHSVREGAHGFFKGRVGVGAVRVENVDVVEAHAAQRLVEGGEEIFAGAPIAVGAGPHGVASFGGDDQFVAVRGEIEAEEFPEIFLGGTGRRAVVVGEIEMGDAEIEGAPDDGAAGGEHIDVAEIVPEPEGDEREFDATAAAAAVQGRAVVAISGGKVGSSHGERG